MYSNVVQKAIMHAIQVKEHPVMLSDFLGHFDHSSPALCVEMGFYSDISWESRYNIEINVWAHFYKILLVFEVSFQPWVKGMSGKS